MREKEDSKCKAPKTAYKKKGYSWAVSYFQGNPITSKIWSQTYVIAFQESIHRLFNQ